MLKSFEDSEKCNKQRKIQKVCKVTVAAIVKKFFVFHRCNEQRQTQNCGVAESDNERETTKIWNNNNAIGVIQETNEQSNGTKRCAKTTMLRKNVMDRRR